MDSSPPTCDLRIGTSGYDYPEWAGPFYPRGLGRREYLGYYSEHFGSIELNFSYYGMPRAEKLLDLLSRTRRPIDFSIKAHQSLTHKIDSATWKDSLDLFRKGITPLHKGGRLFAVLLSFPFSFHYREEERRYLARLLQGLKGLPLVVEFRNAEWFNARTIDGLKERKVGLCAVDLPRLEGLPPLSDLVTSDIAYVRFHGRNGENWWAGNSSSRYEYLYSKEELETWIPRLEAMSCQARAIRLYFNNHPRGDAPANARELTALVTAAKLV